MQPISDLIKIIFDNTIKLTHKISVFIFVLFCLWIFDKSFEFSSTIIINNKIKQIENIESLINKASTSKFSKQQLLEIEKETISQKTIYNSIRQSFTSLTNIIQIYQYSIFWHIIIVNWWVIVLLVFFCQWFISDSNKSKSLRNLKPFLKMFFVCVTYSIITSFLLLQIPLFKPQIFNYVLNFCISTTIGFFLLIKVLYNILNDVNDSLEKLRNASKPKPKD